MTCSSFLLMSYGVNDDKQKIVELLKKSKNYYDKTNQFKMNTSYKVYLGNSNKAVESYDGLFIKNNKNYYSKIGETEFIVTPTNTIKIDNESRLMQYIKEENSGEQVIYDLVKYCDNFGTFNLTSNSTDWICTLNSREVTFIPYSKIIIYLSKTDYSITKQELYILSTIPDKDSNGKVTNKYPKLEITFSDIKLNELVEEYFKLSNYIEIKKGKFYPVKKYSSYQIVD